MRYLGGKARTAKAIVQAIVDDARAATDVLPYWVEPFVGGGSTMVAAAHSGAFDQIAASDIDPYVVAYWRAIRDGWVPPTVVTEDEYRDVKASPETFDMAYVAHVAYNCSFGGKRWGGYARGFQNDKFTPRNFADESSRRDIATAGAIATARIHCGDYVEALRAIPAGAVLYCDPPYAGTTGYASGSFDHAAFWTRVVDLAESDVLVYVSEYAAPSDVCAVPVWSRTVTKSVAGGSGERPVVTDNVFRVHPRPLAGQGHRPQTPNPHNLHVSNPVGRE